MARVTVFEARLRQAFSKVDPANVTLALRLIRGEAKPLEVPAARALAVQCFNPPGHHYLLMTALDSLLETHGCEYLGEVHMHNGPPVEYLNTGDPYVATLLWYRDKSRPWAIGGWADALEWCERKGIIKRDE